MSFTDIIQNHPLPFPLIQWMNRIFRYFFLAGGAYFYWVHRFMHLKIIYPLVHRVHHLSIEPTPFAAFAFHPAESILESLVYLVFAVTLPLHWSVLFLFSLFSLCVNVYGHLGFNAISPKIRDSWPLSMFSHSAHHGWHHRHYQGNYGFYLKFWDQVMGTYRGLISIYLRKWQNLYRICHK